MLNPTLYQVQVLIWISSTPQAMFVILDCGHQSHFAYIKELVAPEYCCRGGGQHGVLIELLLLYSLDLALGY